MCYHCFNSPQILSSVLQMHSCPSFCYYDRWPVLPLTSKLSTPVLSILFLHLSAPFSVVDCCLFLKILSSLGFYDTMLSWLSSIHSPLLTLTVSRLLNFVVPGSLLVLCSIYILSLVSPSIHSLDSENHLSAKNPTSLSLVLTIPQKSKLI